MDFWIITGCWICHLMQLVSSTLFSMRFTSMPQKESGPG